MADEAKINIGAKSDTYDRVLNKVKSLNAELSSEVGNVKSSLESLNPVYSKLAENAEHYAKSLSAMKRASRGKWASVMNNNPSSSGNSSRGHEVTRQLESQYNAVSNTLNKENTKNMNLISRNMVNLSSVASGKGNLNRILGQGLKSTASHANVLTTALRGSAGSLGAVGASAGSAGAGLASVGGGALAATLGVAGLTLGLLIVVGVLAKIGEKGYKSQLAIANAQNVLGTSFRMAYDNMKKLNEETGIAEDRAMQMVANGALVGRSSGMSTASSANLGVGMTKMASNISSGTGYKAEEVNADLLNAVQSGANTVGKYGVNMDDNAVKAHLLKTTGVDAFNGSISKSAMEVARLNFLMLQLNTIQYEGASSSNTLTAKYEKLKNTWDSLGKNVAAVFIPVFQAVVEVLEYATSGLLKLTNGVRDLLGYDPITFADNLGPSEKSLSKVQDLYSGYKATGDELDKLRAQLYGFDEVITQNPYDPAIGKIGEVDIETGNNNKNKDKEKDKGAVAFPKPLVPIVPGMTGNPFANWTTHWNNFKLQVQEQLQGFRLPNWLTNPVPVGIKLLEPVFGPVLGWLKNLNPSLQLDLTLDALKGKGSQLLDWVMDNSLMLTPLGLPVMLTFGGLAVIEKLKASNVTWQTTVEFLHLDTLKAGFMDAVTYLETKLNSIGNWATDIGESISSWFSGVDWGGIFETVMKIADILSWVALIIPGLGAVGAVAKGVSAASKVSKGVKAVEAVNAGSKASKGGGFLSTAGGKIKDFFNVADNVPAYATGGFHVKKHLGIVGDVPEVTLPLHSTAANPAYAGIANNIMTKMGNAPSADSGSSVTVNLGHNSTIIADQYSVRLFGDKIADHVEQRLRNTGRLGFGAR